MLSCTDRQAPLLFSGVEWLNCTEVKRGLFSICNLTILSKQLIIVNDAERCAARSTCKFYYIILNEHGIFGG